MAAAGVASRRQCEELILTGDVSVNRRVVDTLPAFVDPEKDIITIHGKRIRQQRTVYFFLNKPKSVICTNFDPQGRRKAIDLIPASERIFCVGRLDADTSGLIILTNDSELTNKLTHPKYELSKTYVAEVKGQVTPEMVEKLKKGVWLAEGKTGRSAIKILKRGHEKSLLEIIITQGLNRQVRRMLLKVGLPVKSLKRTHIGRLSVKGIGIGKFRTLTKPEIDYLKKITSE